MKTIVVIDDDVNIGNMLEEVLLKKGYKVMRAYSGSEALLLLEKITPNLILLDLMLPAMSGEKILKKVKNIPTIIVSAKINVEDKVNLLMDGAVDYITKPFDINELLARVTVALRNQNPLLKEVYNYSDIRVNTESHSVKIGETNIYLTKTEYAILKLLIQNSGQLIAKSVILDKISEDTLDCTESSLKTHISHLRQKMRQVSGKEYIESVWGIGFKLISK